MKYVCVKKCYFNDRLWAPGEILEARGSVPNHFKLVGCQAEKSAPVDKPKAPEATKAVDDLLS